jgi:hypothetical protein
MLPDSHQARTARLDAWFADHPVDDAAADQEYVPTAQDRREAALAFAMSDLTQGDQNRSFPELIEHWAELFAGEDHDVRYIWMSERLAQLATDARTLGATTPQQFEEREEVCFSCCVARSGLAIVKQVAHNIFEREPAAAYMLDQAASLIRPSLNR